MIRFIVGRSGSGKTERLYRDIRDTLEGGFSGNVLLIVPEQFTFETERALLGAMPKSGCLHVDVCGFDRLIFRVLAETGALARTFLTRHGKDMLIRKVMDETDAQGAFGKAAKQAGFAGVCGDWFAVFKRSGITPGMLLEASLSVKDTAFGQKLSGLSSIFGAVEQHLGERYLDLEDAYRLFLESAPDSAFLRGARVFVDGFDQLSKQDYAMLEALMLCAQELTVTLRLPERSDADAHIFAPEQFVFDTLTDIAARNAVPRSVIKPGLTVKRSAALRALERGLFSAGTGQYAIDDSLRVYECGDPAQEALRAARRVCALVRGGLRFRDIAVLLPDIAAYAPHIAHSFAEHGIPFFLDAKRPLLSHSISDFLLAATSAAVLGFRPYDMQRVLKSGYAITNDTIAERMSLYMQRYGVRAFEFTRPFTRGDEAGALEEARENLMAPLVKYRDALKRKAITARESAEALYRYMEAVGLSEQLSNLAARLKAQKRFELARENAQVWDVLMQALDQIVIIFGDAPLAPERFLSLLEEGVRARTVGIIPTTADQVLVGDIARTISRRMKVVMALGVNEGLLPKRYSDDELLIESECEELRELGLPNLPDNSQKEARERMDIYVAFARATDALELSYSLSSGGEELLPSPLVERVKALFPDIGVSRDDDNALYAPRASFGPLVSALRGFCDSGETHVSWAESAYAWYAKTPPWDAAVERAGLALTLRGGMEALPSGLARALFTRPHTSPSRIEAFTRCPFQHFIKYGLSPDLREEFVPKAPDVGSFLHTALDALTREIAASGLDWAKLTRDDISALIGALWEPMLESFQNGLLRHSARNALLSRRLKRLLRESLFAVATQIAAGAFRPVGSELLIGEDGAFPPLTLTLKGGGRLMLTGVIDRVDAAKIGGETYYRIVDYKTRETSLSLSELYFGLKPQMPLYMKAVLDAYGGGCKPAGMFYFHVDDPLAENETERAKKFRMSGLILKDENVLRATDSANEKRIVSAYVKKGGGVSGNGALDENDLSLALERVKALSEAALSRVLAGEANARPLQRGKKSACDACDFLSVCGFDEQIEGFSHYSPPALSEEELLALLRKNNELD